jgi:hypothetical protein
MGEAPERGAPGKRSLADHRNIVHKLLLLHAQIPPGFRIGVVAIEHMSKIDVADNRWWVSLNLPTIRFLTSLLFDRYAASLSQFPDQPSSTSALETSIRQCHPRLQHGHSGAEQTVCLCLRRGVLWG